jgi:hypothetical protein
MSASSGPPDPPVAQITLAAYIDQEWRESSYSTDDHSWREALKILQAASIPVKLIYPPTNLK